MLSRIASHPCAGMRTALDERGPIMLGLSTDRSRSGGGAHRRAAMAMLLAFLLVCILPATSFADGSSVRATAAIMGTDAHDNAQVWVPETGRELPSDSTAADLLLAVFEDAGLVTDHETGEYGLYIKTITSPFDGRVLGWDEATGRFWQLFVNGAASQEGASSVVLENDDEVVLRYSAFGEGLPGEGDVVLNPSAPRPSLESSWPGFGSLSTPTRALTPVEAAQEKWTRSFAGGKGLPEPIIVGGNLYVASGDTLTVLDAQTGRDLRSAKLATSIDSTCRLVYADGLVVVPLHGGRLQALTADTLTTVWLTEPLPKDDSAGHSLDQQSLGTLLVHDDCVIAGTSDGLSDGSGAGFLSCVSLDDGSVRWREKFKGGFYWAGPVAFKGRLVIGDDSGRVYAVDPSNGKIVGTPLDLGVQVRSGVVTDGVHLYVVDYHGSFHKLAMGDDGTITELSSVTFSNYCTSTPCLVDGKAVICGRSATQGPSEWMKYAAVFVIDTDSMTLEAEVCQTSDGGNLPTMFSQSSPLVSVQSDGAYAYFTVNWKPSGLYRYKLGEGSVDVLYTPSDDKQQYCLASVVAGSDGSLYYSNDSGTLFALKGAASWKVTFDPQNGAAPSSVHVRQGMTVERPVDPVRAGHVFGGWFADVDCKDAWDFSSPVTGDLTLYAKWTPQSDGTGSEGDTTGGSQHTGSSDSVKPKAPASSSGVPAPQGGKHSVKDGESASDEDKGEVMAIASKPKASVEKKPADASSPFEANPLTPLFAGLAVIGVLGLGGAILWLVALNRRR